jgi:hypothetical protein
MRNNRSDDSGKAAALRCDLRSPIRHDLENLGVAPQLSESVAQRLEGTVGKLSPQEYRAVLGSVAAAYGERSEEGGLPGALAEDFADVQRLMQGFSEEVQKLDEGLRMLSAYVSRLRKRGARSPVDTLH